MLPADALPDYRTHVRLIVQDVAPQTYNPQSGRLAEHALRDFHAGRTVKECAERWISRHLQTNVEAAQ